MAKVTFIESSAVLAVGLTKTEMLLFTKNGLAYGYSIEALKTALGVKKAEIKQLYKDLARGAVSAGQTWAHIKKSLATIGETARKYTYVESADLLEAAH